MPIVTEQRSQNLVLELVHVMYALYSPGSNIYFEYSPVTGLIPSPFVPFGGPFSDYYKDEGYWRFFTNQGNATIVYGNPLYLGYTRPDLLPTPGWSWSLSDLPDLPMPASVNAYLAVIVQARVIGGGGALPIAAGETLTQDYVTFTYRHDLPSTGINFQSGVGYNQMAGTGLRKSWDAFTPNPGGSVARFTTDAFGKAVRETDIPSVWVASGMGGAIGLNVAMGVRIDDSGVNGPRVNLLDITAVRHWTVTHEEVVVPVALLESAGEAGSATSVRVAAAPPGPPGMMGAVRLTRVLEVAPPKPERVPPTRPRIEEG